MYASNGEEPDPPVPFLPPNANAQGLLIFDDTAYVATINGCGGAPNGVWALDLKSKRVTQWEANANIAGTAGPVAGPESAQPHDGESAVGTRFRGDPGQVFHQPQQHLTVGNRAGRGVKPLGQFVEQHGAALHQAVAESGAAHGIAKRRNGLRVLGGEKAGQPGHLLVAFGQPRPPAFDALRQVCGKHRAGGVVPEPFLERTAPVKSPAQGHHCRLELGQLADDRMQLVGQGLPVLGQPALNTAQLGDAGPALPKTQALHGVGGQGGDAYHVGIADLFGGGHQKAISISYCAVVARCPIAIWNIGRWPGSVMPSISCTGGTR